MHDTVWTAVDYFGVVPLIQMPRNDGRNRGRRPPPDDFLPDPIGDFLVSEFATLPSDLKQNYGTCLLCQLDGDEQTTKIDTAEQRFAEDF